MLAKYKIQTLELTTMAKQLHQFPIQGVSILVTKGSFPHAPLVLHLSSCFGQRFSFTPIDLFILDSSFVVKCIAWFDRTGRFLCSKVGFKIQVEVFYYLGFLGNGRVASQIFVRRKRHNVINRRLQKQKTCLL